MHFIINTITVSCTPSIVVYTACAILELPTLCFIIPGPLPSEVNAEIRMREIVGRSRLVELAKAQAKEVGVLRKEVERLRMRTFPALVQVDNF